MLKLKTCIFISTLIIATLLAACQTLPLNKTLPDNLKAEKIAIVDEDSPFSVSPDGNVVAVASEGLILLHIPTKEQIRLSTNTPAKLSWAPFGSSLAAIFIEAQKSRIIVYDQFGSRYAEAVVDSPLTDIGWLSETELALGGAIIRQYKFGSNYRSILYRWKPGRDNPVMSELRNSTLQPKTIRNMSASLERGPLMDFSSQTPLISYLHPAEPPLFPPYYKLIVRDLASGKELEVASFSLNSAGAKLSADGEKILFADGNGSTILLNPWSEELLFKVGSHGFAPSLSPDGISWFADGALFRSGALLTTLAPGGSGEFSADGSRLLVRTGKELYLLTGLRPAEGTRFVQSLEEKVQKLRSMRAEGLISAKEYKEAIEKIGQP